MQSNERAAADRGTTKTGQVDCLLRGRRSPVSRSAPIGGLGPCAFKGVAKVGIFVYNGRTARRIEVRICVKRA